jgi:putative ABC transport system substrate-binding protein
VAGLPAAGLAGLSARHVGGQAPPRMLRVGFVSPASPRTAPHFVALEARFRELGYVEGQGFTLDFITLEGRLERYGEAMRALVARRADVIIAIGPEDALRAAIAAAGNMPIVMLAIDYDPLALGYIASLARPGGNVTGIFLRQIELAVKRLQFLHEAFPDLRAATVFWDGQSESQWQAARDLSSSLGITLAGVELAGGRYDYDEALTRAPNDHRRVLSVCNSPRFFADRVRLAEFALRHRVATMFSWREWVDVGGLMSYGPNFVQVTRRAADYVDRIARGAKPAELPVEQPTRFELVINMKTAKALGLSLPPSLLARADEVLE